MPFPGDPDRYPARDEVADYLDRYAAAVPVEIQTNTRVTTVRQDDGGFSVLTADGRRLTAAGVVAASGSFSKPHRPIFPGQASDQDVHYWLRETGFDALPADWLSKIGEGSLITDSTGLRSA
jgi:cation diffusion facilitator CzcD-associated flavoprotein CzcO